MFLMLAALLHNLYQRVPSFHHLRWGQFPCMSSATFKVKVPDDTLKSLDESSSWVPSKHGRQIWSIAPSFNKDKPEWLEQLLKKILIRGSKAAGEVLIPVGCVLSRLVDQHASCPVHSHDFDQLTLVLGASRPMLIGDSTLMLQEGGAVKIDAGVPHGVPEQYSTCLPRVSINLYVATQAQASSQPLSTCLLPRGELEPCAQLCAFAWARPGALDEDLRPTDDTLLNLHMACLEAFGEGIEPPKKRRKQNQVPSELPPEWGVDSKVALDFAGLSVGAREVCFERLQKVFKNPHKVGNINSYCSSVIKGVGDTFGAKLQPKLLKALSAKLEGSGWTLADMDSSAVGALAGLPQANALEIVGSMRPGTISNLSAFLTGAVKRQGAACPLRKALGSGWHGVERALANSSGEVSSQTLVQAIKVACDQQTAESFEIACSALLRFPDGSKPPLSTYNQIFKAAGHVGRWLKALDLFSKLPDHLQPNRYTYTALFDAVVRGGGPQTMLWALWNTMQRSGVVADQQLMSTMLQGCSDAVVVDQLLGELDWQGISPTLELLTSMVACYRRAGAPTNKTWEVLKLAKDKNLALDCQFLVQVVTALGFANDTGAVVLLMESARHVYKVNLDVYVYTAAISQCARAGDVLGAETIIRQMQQDQVEANEHTHCAIIAVYSKAGLLPKAVEYFYQADSCGPLPIEAYCSILSGCRAVLDHQCALRILKKARRAGPVKSACYTLARQACALAGDDAGAAKVDRWQKVDGVVTHIPTSTVDDPSTGEKLPFQPGYDEASALPVKSMMTKLKKAGYSPELWQYDPEISDDQREDRLQYHTEKKALAWALQHFPEGSAITVRKTIRCCVDCHNAFKVASHAYGRSLRILDQVRMHEFSAGKCSCGDWW